MVEQASDPGSRELLPGDIVIQRQKDTFYCKFKFHVV